MAVTPKKLARTQLGTTSSTLYTVPSSTKTLIKSIVIHNTSSSDASVTLAIAGTNILTNTVISAKSTFTLDSTIVMDTASETITGLASVGSTLNIFISGAEVV